MLNFKVSIRSWRWILIYRLSPLIAFGVLAFFLPLLALGAYLCISALVFLVLRDESDEKLIAAGKRIFHTDSLLVFSLFWGIFVLAQKEFWQSSEGLGFSSGGGTDISAEKTEKFRELVRHSNAIGLEISQRIDSLFSLVDDDEYADSVSRINNLLVELEKISSEYSEFSGGEQSQLLSQGGYSSEDFIGFKKLKSKGYVDVRDNSVHFHDMEIAYFFATVDGYLPLISLEVSLEEQRMRKAAVFYWDMDITNAYKRAYKNLSHDVRIRAQGAMADILSTDEDERALKSKPLINDKKGLWSYRFGQHRVIYKPNYSSKTVVFVDVSARKDSYRNL